GSYEKDAPEGSKHAKDGPIDFSKFCAAAGEPQKRIRFQQSTPCRLEGGQGVFRLRFFDVSSASFGWGRSRDAFLHLAFFLPRAGQDSSGDHEQGEAHGKDQQRSTPELVRSTPSAIAEIECGAKGVHRTGK